MITGAAVCAIALGLYARQLPPIKSITAKVYGAAVGFGIFSIAFPLGWHWSFVLIGMVLQLVAVVCCVLAAHDYRTSRAMQTVRKNCRKLGREMRADFDRDRVLCNAFFAEGVRAGERKKMK